VVGQFKAAFPKVHLALHQATPGEIATLLLAGEADLGIATEALASVGELAAFPFYHWRHAVIAPAGHPLLTESPLALEALVEHPLITYQEGFTGRSQIDAGFARAGLIPDIVISALDADVIKTYVELGLGIGIIAAMAFDPVRDSRLRLLDSAHLFEGNTTWIAVRKGHYLRNFAYRFIELCNPKLTEPFVRGVSSLSVSAALSGQGSDEQFNGGAGI